MKPRVIGSALAVVVAAGLYGATTLRATPPAGFVGTTLAVARFDEIDVHNVGMPAWQAKLKTQGLSDVYFQSNVWAPGGTTGWHTHPGHSLIIVTAGTVTAYEGDDPSCTPHVYTQGMGFVDPGDDHVHNIRNEGEVEARTLALQMVPAEAIRRIDAPSPGNCPF